MDFEAWKNIFKEYARARIKERSRFIDLDNTFNIPFEIRSIWSEDDILDKQNDDNSYDIIASFNQYCLEDIVNLEKYFLIVAQGGGGKTTLLMQILNNFINGNSVFIPFYIESTEIYDEQIKDIHEHEKFFRFLGFRMKQWLGRESGEKLNQEFKSFDDEVFKQYLSENSIIIFIDSCDEALEKIDLLANCFLPSLNNIGIPCVFAVREPFKDVLIPKLKKPIIELVLKPLSITECLHKDLVPRSIKQYVDEIGVGPDHFFSLLCSAQVNRNIVQLMDNSFCFSWVAQYFKDNSRFPENIIDFYEDILQSIIRKDYAMAQAKIWKEYNIFEDSISYILEFIAATMTQRGISNFSISKSESKERIDLGLEMLEWAKKKKFEFLTDQIKEDPRQIIKLLTQKGVLIGNNNVGFRFFHQNIQHYFSGRHLYHHNYLLKEEDWEKIIKDVYWNDAILFFVYQLLNEMPKCLLLGDNLRNFIKIICNTIEKSGVDKYDLLNKCMEIIERTEQTIVKLPQNFYGKMTAIRIDKKTIDHDQLLNGQILFLTTLKTLVNGFDDHQTTRNRVWDLLSKGNRDFLLIEMLELGREAVFRRNEKNGFYDEAIRIYKMLPKEFSQEVRDQNEKLFLMKPAKVRDIQQARNLLVCGQVGWYTKVLALNILIDKGTQNDIDLIFGLLNDENWFVRNVLSKVIIKLGSISAEIRNKIKSHILNVNGDARSLLQETLLKIKNEINKGKSLSVLEVIQRDSYSEVNELLSRLEEMKKQFEAGFEVKLKREDIFGQGEYTEKINLDVLEEKQRLLEEYLRTKKIGYVLVEELEKLVGLVETKLRETEPKARKFKEREKKLEETNVRIKEIQKEIEDKTDVSIRNFKGIFFHGERLPSRTKRGDLRHLVFINNKNVLISTKPFIVFLLLGLKERHKEKTEDDVSLSNYFTDRVLSTNMTRIRNEMTDQHAILKEEANKLIPPKTTGYRIHLKRVFGENSKIMINSAILSEEYGIYSALQEIRNNIIGEDESIDKLLGIIESE